MGKDAGFLYTYIKDAQSDNKTELVETWQTIKKDRFHRLDHNNLLILGSQISLSMRSFCSLSGIPEVDFTASIMINSDECRQAVAIINREWYISCPKHVRVSTLCIRLIKPVLNRSEYLV